MKVAQHGSALVAGEGRSLPSGAVRAGVPHASFCLAHMARWLVDSRDFTSRDLAVGYVRQLHAAGAVVRAPGACEVGVRGAC